jgi:hypothetical protein
MSPCYLARIRAGIRALIRSGLQGRRRKYWHGHGGSRISKTCRLYPGILQWAYPCPTHLTHVRQDVGIFKGPPRTTRVEAADIPAHAFTGMRMV